MLLIHVPKLTNRLGYTLNLVFKNVLKVEYKITIKEEEYLSYKGAKLSYGNTPLNEGAHIQSSELLFQTSIEFIDAKPFKWNNLIALFPIYNANSILPFDIFASIFYFVSRYEEYLPHQIDSHSRFKPEDSIASQHGLLRKPIVNIWIQELAKKLKELFPELHIPEGQFEAILTVDIDNAYAYKDKSILRIVGGYLGAIFKLNYKDIILRTQVLLGIKHDPFDTYNFLIANIKKYRLKTIFFVLYGKYGPYDTNLSNNNPRFQRLLKFLGDYAKIGIHPSYASFEDSSLLKKETQKLSATLHKPITRSRFHFIRFRLPESYRVLIDNGIEDDYSMGYPSEIGFRAGICTPYNFYDLENNHETSLRIHPFTIMDATLHHYLNIKAEDAFAYYKNMIDEIRNVNGTFYCIWHNENIGTTEDWKGWKEVFSQVAEYMTR